MRRDTRRGRLSPRKLTWSPPTLSNPLVVTVTDDPATRFIDAAGRDVQLIMPTMVSAWGDFTTRDSLVHVKDPRKVVVIGGHIRALPMPVTTIAAATDAQQTTITVASTAAFPNTGALRIDGEAIVYTGKTATTFTGCTRNFGFFNDSPMSSLAHAVGAAVYLSEAAKQGLSIESPSDVVHLEGLAIDGPMGDGIRIYGTPTANVQVQNCHISAGYSIDKTWQTDGHGDCMQVMRGFGELRLDRVTMITQDGSCLLNQSGDAVKIGKVIARDAEFIGLPGARATVVNRDSATAFECYNAWAVLNGPEPWGTAGGGIARPEIQIDRGAPAEWRFIDPGLVGLNYVSPGYL